MKGRKYKQQRSDGDIETDTPNGKKWKTTKHKQTLRFNSAFNYEVTIPKNVTRDEVVPYLNGQISHIENQINELNYKKEKIMRLLKDLRKDKRADSEEKENQPDISENDLQDMNWSTSKKLQKEQNLLSDITSSIVELTKSNFSQVDFGVFPLSEDLQKSQGEMKANHEKKTPQQWLLAQVLPSPESKSRDSIQIEQEIPKELSIFKELTINQTEKEGPDGQMEQEFPKYSNFFNEDPLKQAEELENDTRMIDEKESTRQGDSDLEESMSMVAEATANDVEERLEKIQHMNSLQPNELFELANYFGLKAIDPISVKKSLHEIEAFYKHKTIPQEYLAGYTPEFLTYLQNQS